MTYIDLVKTIVLDSRQNESARHLRLIKFDGRPTIYKTDARRVKRIINNQKEK